MSIKGHPYFVYDGGAKKPVPIGDVIEAAIVGCRARNPGAHPDVLALHPSLEPVLGRTVRAGGQEWAVSYEGIIGPREVRVGPVD